MATGTQYYTFGIGQPHVQAPAPASPCVNVDISGQDEVGAYLNSAIETIYGLGGGTIQIASLGTYVVETAIRMRPGVRLVGPGRGLLTLKMDPDIDPSLGGTVANVIRIQPSDFSLSGGNIYVGGMSLDGSMNELTSPNWATYLAGGNDDRGCGIEGRGTTAYPLTRVKIEDVEAYNCFYHGIALYEATSLADVSEVYAWGNGFRGVHFHSEDSTPRTDWVNQHNRFNRIRCRANGANAGNTTGNSGFYAVLLNTLDCSLQDIEVYDEAGLGIQIYGVVSTQTYGSSRITGTNLRVNNCNVGIQIGNGVDMLNLSNVLVTNCTYSATDGAGIGIQGASVSSPSNSKWSLSNVQVHGCDGYGMRFEKTSNMAISGAVVMGNSQRAAGNTDGVLLSDCTDVSIDGGVFKAGGNANTSRAIYITASSADASTRINITNAVISNAVDTAPLDVGSNASYVTVSNCNITRGVTPTNPAIQFSGANSRAIGNFMNGGYVNPANGVFTNGTPFKVAAGAKVGATAGWVLGGGAVNTGNMATLPASQTASTLIVPIPMLQEGQSITGWYMVGNVTSSGNTVTIDGDLRRLDAASGGPTDNSYATQSQFTATTNTILSSSNCGKGGSATVWGASRTGYLLVTATTGAACTVTLQHIVFLIAG